jgi:Ca2+-binding RTX toxin-like protein
MRTKAIEDVFSGLLSFSLKEAFVFGESATKPQAQLIFDPATGILSFDPDGTGVLPQQFISDKGSDGLLVIGEKATAVSPQVVFNPVNGELFVDMDGTGRGSPVQLTTVDAPSLLSFAVTIFKNLFNNLGGEQPSGNDHGDHAKPSPFSDLIGNFEQWFQFDNYSDLPGFFDHFCGDWSSIDRVSIRGTNEGDNLVGTPGPDSIRGLAGGDILKGLAGDDWIVGGFGSDQIYGGPGTDRLWGGEGQDRFFFDAPIVSGEIDMIKDFHAGTDDISLSATVFKALTPQTPLGNAAFFSGAGAVAAQTADQRIILNTTTGALFYDSDGVNGVAAAQFATLLPSGLNGIVSASDFNVIA